MFLNTFEHGYADGVAGKQCVYGSVQYREGYHEGRMSKIRQKREARLMFVLAAIASIAMGGAMAVSLAEAAGGLPV
jgi:hypothetical protein